MPFAALNVLGRTVIGRSMQRHRHQGFSRLLSVINAVGGFFAKLTRRRLPLPRWSPGRHQSIRIRNN
jgi:hypothetical protein